MNCRTPPEFSINEEDAVSNPELFRLPTSTLSLPTSYRKHL